MWSYLVTDLRTTQVIGRCPLTSVTFAEQLGGVGSFTGRTPAAWPGWSLLPGDDLKKRIIWPMRAGRPVGAYLLSKVPAFDPAIEQDRGVQADHLAAIFMRRVIRDTISFTQVDQNNIIRDLFRYGLGTPTQFASPIVNGTTLGKAIPWIRLDSTTSGVLRDRKEVAGNTDDGYPAAARKIIGTCVKQLTELDDGAELRWLYGLDSAGLPYMQLDTGGASNSHRVGRPKGDTPQIVFEHPSRTVASARFGADGDTIVTRAHVTGQEKEGSRPVGESTGSTLIDQGVPLLESVWSESSVQEQATLDAKAAARRTGAARSWTLSLNGDLPPTFTTYGLGDVVTLRVRRLDGVQMPDQDLRVTGWSVDVDDSLIRETVQPTVEMVQ